MPTPDSKWFPPALEIQTLLAGKTVFCSFSGGADSLSLLILLQQWKQEFTFQLNAVHFEHGFRGQASLDDAEFCREICEERQIPFQMYSLNVPNQKLSQEGDEEAARRCRLEAWKRIADENSVIALGHHANDRIENLLLRLFRGSNVSGLTSMRPVQKLNGLTFIRPLLEKTRSEIEEWLRSCGILQWCHDFTNDSTQYRRNMLRLKLLPEIQTGFPFASCGLRQSLRAMEEDACCLEDLAKQYYFEVKKNAGLDVQLLARIPAALQVRILRLFLQDELHTGYVPDAQLINRFKQLLRNPRPISLPITNQPGKMLCCRHHSIIIVGKGSEQKVIWDTSKHLIFRNTELRAEWISPKDMHFERNAETAYFDADQIRFPLTVSDWEIGDRMIPFGRKKTVSLKKLFANASINTEDRKKYPVIRDQSGKILWVAGFRNSAEALVQPQTSHILQLLASRPGK